MIWPTASGLPRCMVHLSTANLRSAYINWEEIQHAEMLTKTHILYITMTTHLVAVMLGGAAAVAVSGRRRCHLFATWLPSPHRRLVSVETAATKITAEPPGASLWPLKATPRHNSLHCRERLKQTQRLRIFKEEQQQHAGAVRKESLTHCVSLTNRNEIIEDMKSPM